MLYAGMKNEIVDPELCIERLISFSPTYGPSLLSSGGAPEASVGQRFLYAWRAKPPAPRAPGPVSTEGGPGGRAKF